MEEFLTFFWVAFVAIVIWLIWPPLLYAILAALVIAAALTAISKWIYGKED